jgi:hypothetical protein
VLQVRCQLGIEPRDISNVEPFAFEPLAPSVGRDVEKAGRFQSRKHPTLEQSELVGHSQKTKLTQGLEIGLWATGLWGVRRVLCRRLFRSALFPLFRHDIDDAIGVFHGSVHIRF